MLRYFPEAGRIGSSPGTREWVLRQYPYILVYEIMRAETDAVVILGVFHAARDERLEGGD